MKKLLALLPALGLLLCADGALAEAKVLEVKGAKKGKKWIPSKGLRPPTKDELTSVDVVPKDDDEVVELAPLAKGKRKKKEERVLVDGKPLGEEDEVSARRGGDTEIYVDEAPPSIEEQEAAKERARDAADGADSTEEATASDNKFRRRR